MSALIMSQWLVHLLIMFNLTCFRLPFSVNSRISALPGTSRMEDRASNQPSAYAQSGYTYQRLKVRGLYLTIEQTKDT